MKRKIVSLSIFLAIVLGIGFISAGNVQAQTATFPAGCTSALGYSVTNGVPCNGTSAATNGPLPGCTTALGYSIVNGVPCSGSSTALSFLAGCASTSGVSTIDPGKNCDGTTVTASTGTTVTTTAPGLPKTGEGGNASRNVMTLLISGLIAVGGFTYLVRKPSIA